MATDSKKATGTPPEPGTGAALKLIFQNLAASPIPRVMPGGPALLAALDCMGEYVERTDRRIAALEAAMTDEQRREARLAAAALDVVGHGASDGVLGAPIPDAERPGGAQPGDLPAGAVPG